MVALELEAWIGGSHGHFASNEIEIEISDKDYALLTKLAKEYEADATNINEDDEVEWEFFNEYISENNPKLYKKILKKVMVNIQDGW